MEVIAEQMDPDYGDGLWYKDSIRCRNIIWRIHGKLWFLNRNDLLNKLIVVQFLDSFGPASNLEKILCSSHRKLYELVHQTTGLGSTHCLACLISAVWTLGCRYWFLFGHWDVVAYISNTEPATTSQCPTRNR